MMVENAHADDSWDDGDLLYQQITYLGMHLCILQELALQIGFL